MDLYEAAARPEAAAFDGSQAVDLSGSPGEGIIETTFATIPGTNYELVFHYARIALMDPATGSAQVEVTRDDTLLQDAVVHGSAMYDFSTYVESAGRLVRNLFRGTQPAGLHRLPWFGVGDDGAGVASSVCFVRLTTAHGTVSHRLTVVE